jgi:ergothioneine biosynthesis protein EgtB
MLWQDMVACRDSTLRLVADLSEAEFQRQAHPDFSPVGWHLGHIAFTESLWLLEQLKQEPCAYPQYQQLFAADGLPKTEREKLPPLTEILAFLAAVRDRTLTYLETAPLCDQLRLWRWLLQHESQHAETVTYMLALHRWGSRAVDAIAPAPSSAVSPSMGKMLPIAGGTFEMGSDSVDALDNERSPHPVTVADFWLDPTPVTTAAYQTFIAAGGYQNAAWWQHSGWAWVQAQGITQPRYWCEHSTWQETPVCGVSWYEADAYARFVGKRLPTEAEWEWAARYQPVSGETRIYPWGETPLTSNHGNFGGDRDRQTPVGTYPLGRSATGCDDLLGNVWEWTASWFVPYPGFMPYPYKGYSATYFDNAHRVLRGGSWATRPWVLRPTFRNWYHPTVQEIFAGFRCARSC